jgi:maltodextrin utilization protein YvdJ
MKKYLKWLSPSVLQDWTFSMTGTPLDLRRMITGKNMKRVVVDLIKTPWVAMQLAMYLSLTAATSIVVMLLVLSFLLANLVTFSLGTLLDQANRLLSYSIDRTVGM